MKKHFTIGMAGHIDHGKTTLTKALTNWDTDRLKEEKERNISIELGFAPLVDEEDIHVSIIDVPGHERFIKQMIAGVAGIDLVVLVVAADEGVMPQTKEHIEILELLGVTRGIVAISKADKVEADMLELAMLDVESELLGTVFEGAAMIPVDSLSGTGVEVLRALLADTVSGFSVRDDSGAFRMPIDQVFTVKGQGTIVRGTVYDGRIAEGDDLMIAPREIATKVRQMQLFGAHSPIAVAGQRVAINLAGVHKSAIKKGDVLINGSLFRKTTVVDVNLIRAKKLVFPLKQRATLKCYFGATEVVGTIVFFDRNDIGNDTEEILCQLRLHEPVVIKQGDRFIIRRPSPAETIGGGFVIDPQGEKYKFGEQTIAHLQKKQSGTANERVLKLLSDASHATKEEIMLRTSLTDVVLDEIVLREEKIVSIAPDVYSSTDTIHHVNAQIMRILEEQHAKFPMKIGIKKAELLQKLTDRYGTDLLTFILNENQTKIRLKDEFIALAYFVPHIPVQWEKRISQVLDKVLAAGFSVNYLDNYYDEASIPEKLRKDFTNFLVSERKIIALDENFYIDQHTFDQAVDLLKKQKPTAFETKEAKEIIKLSRKMLIPFLETLDRLGETKRQDNVRMWVK